MSDDIDPEIAALLGSPSSPPARPGGGGEPPPDFSALFGELEPVEKSAPTPEGGVDLSRKRFAPVEETEAAVPADYFSDPEYYKKAIGGEGDEATKLHEILGKYLKSADPKDKGVYRQQLIPAYWYLAAKLALRCAAASPPLPKRLLLRFGALLPTLLSAENRDAVQRVIFERKTDEPVYYVDEWVRAVATGAIKASATDEVKTRPGDEKARYSAILERAAGKRSAAEGIVKAKAEERRSLEALLGERVDSIARHEAGDGGLPAPYTEQQKKTMNELAEILRKMLAVDRELAGSFAEYNRAHQEYEATRQKAQEAGGVDEVKADFKSVAAEFETVRQMAKLCIGRQGNQFPFLSKEYFHGTIKDMGTRENVLRQLAWIESIDVEAFCRPYKNTLNRIVPFVVVIPCFGDYGICWEPFDRYNRATSRGRIALPLYPKNLQLAVVTAVADLRWQVAKEKAAYYWMEEGLTGYYYQWFSAKKIKGDVKEYFIQDYVLWITKEAEGIQKLDKEVRAMFWRFMPFAQELKDKLKTRSYVYQELYQKDINRSLSDGY